MKLIELIFDILGLCLGIIVLPIVGAILVSVVVLIIMWPLVLYFVWSVG